MLINWMQHCPPWQPNGSTAGTQISHLWWNPKVHYRVRNRQSPVPTLCQTNPIHVLQSNSLGVSFQHYSRIYAYVFQVFSPSGFCTKALYEFSSFLRMRHAPPISFFLIQLKSIWQGVHIMKLRTVQLLQFSRYFITSLNHHHHHHHWLDSPWWALAFLRSFVHSSLLRATLFQFLTSNNVVKWTLKK